MAWGFEVGGGGDVPKITFENSFISLFHAILYTVKHNDACFHANIGKRYINETNMIHDTIRWKHIEIHS